MIWGRISAEAPGGPVGPGRSLLPVLLPLLLALVGVGCQESPTSLARPNLIRRAGDGVIHVSDFHHQRIVRFDPTGTFRSAFGERGLGEGQLWQVWGLLVESPDRIQVINQRITAPGAQTTLWEVKTFEQEREQAVHPLYIPTVQSQDEVWLAGLTRGFDGGYLVLDQSVRVIHHFDASWRHRGQGTAPGGGEPFQAPTCIRRKGEDIWVVDQYAHQVLRLGRDGRLLAVIGEEGTGPGQLRFPFAVDVCPGRWVAVADMGNYRVQRFDLAGRYLDGFEPAGVDVHSPVQLLDVLVTPTCDRLYLVDSKGNRVLVTTPQGNVLQTLHGWD